MVVFFFNQTLQNMRKKSTFWGLFSGADLYTFSALPTYEISFSGFSLIMRFVEIKTNVLKKSLALPFNK